MGRTGPNPASMLTRLLKIASTVLGVDTSMIVIACLALFATSADSPSKTYDLPSSSKLATPISADEASIARGKLIATTLGDCTHCPGLDFAGGKVPIDPMFGEFNSAHLTPGTAGVGAVYAPRTLCGFRYDVKTNGRSILVMPSNELNHPELNFARALMPIRSGSWLQTCVDGETPAAVATAWIWAGMVPQQPPMIVAPSCRHSRLASA